MAEGFSAEPSELDGYAGQVKRNTGHVDAIHAYLGDAGSDTSEMEGLLAGIANGYKPLVGWQQDILQNMSKGMTGTATALGNAAKQYRKDDDVNSAALDKLYKENQKAPN